MTFDLSFNYLEALSSCCCSVYTCCCCCHCLLFQSEDLRLVRTRISWDWLKHLDHLSLSCGSYGAFRPNIHFVLLTQVDLYSRYLRQLAEFYNNPQDDCSYQRYLRQETNFRCSISAAGKTTQTGWDLFRSVGFVWICLKMFSWLLC